MESDMLKSLEDYLINITPDQEAEMIEFFKDDTPKGWISIEDGLPQWRIEDFEQGYSVYKVKFNDGYEDFTKVCDHGIWYYESKKIGITHWFNGTESVNE